MMSEVDNLTSTTVQSGESTTEQSKKINEDDEDNASDIDKDHSTELPLNKIAEAPATKNVDEEELQSTNKSNVADLPSTQAMGKGEECHQHESEKDECNITKENKEICDVCQGDGKDNEAVMMCRVCEENLCNPCTEQNKKQKAAQSHKLTDLSKLKDVQTATICDVCFDENEQREAVLFCTVCDEQLCQPCADKHRKRKATLSHSLIPSVSLSSDKNDNDKTQSCNPCNILNKPQPAVILS